MTQLMMPQDSITSEISVRPTSLKYAETRVVQLPLLVEMGGASTQWSGWPGRKVPVFGAIVTVPTVSAKLPLSERIRTALLLSGVSSMPSSESMPCQIVGWHFKSFMFLQLVSLAAGQ